LVLSSAGERGLLSGGGGGAGAEKARPAAAPTCGGRRRCGGGGIVFAPLPPRTKSASQRRSGGAAAAAQRRWQDNGTAARGVCLFSGAVGAVIGRARPFLRAGCSGAAVGAAAEVVGDAAARRREGFSSMLGYVSLCPRAYK